VSALELEQASGAPTPDLTVRTRKALRAAGGRALVLHAYAAAARSFEAAAALTLEPDPDRPRALLRHGAALVALLDPRRFDVLEEARSALIDVDDTDGAAEADIALAEAWWWAGERERCAECLDRAAEVVGRGDPSIVTAFVLAQIARFHSLFGEDQTAIEHGRESLRLAEHFGHDELRAKNLITLGTARFFGEDSEREAAIDDVRAGIVLAAACGDLMQLSRGYVNLSSLLLQSGKLAEAEASVLDAAQLAQRRDNVPAMRFAEGNMIEFDALLGRWQASERREWVPRSVRGGRSLHGRPRADVAEPDPTRS
jgi:tetratricopeptide (TPR) repeat protein